jgi:hypothetical protein
LQKFVVSFLIRRELWEFGLWEDWHGELIKISIKAANLFIILYAFIDATNLLKQDGIECDNNSPGVVGGCID